MSETASETTTATTETVTAETAPATNSETSAPTDTAAWADAFKGKTPEEVAKALEHARTWEQRAKENAGKAKEFDAFQESQKTEQQKIADRATAAERERDEAKADGLRYKAAARFGIGEDYFDLLGSGDEEAISGRAERVGKLLAASKELEQVRTENEALRQGKPVPGSGRPTEALRPGATPTTPGGPSDSSYPAEWLPTS